MTVPLSEDPCLPHVFLFIDTKLPNGYIKILCAYVFVCQFVCGKVTVTLYKIMSKLFHAVIIFCP
jgi:hypothetical protein